MNKTLLIGSLISAGLVGAIGITYAAGGFKPSEPTLWDSFKGEYTRSSNEAKLITSTKKRDVVTSNYDFFTSSVCEKSLLGENKTNSLINLLKTPTGGDIEDDFDETTKRLSSAQLKKLKACLAVEVAELKTDKITSALISWELAIKGDENAFLIHGFVATPYFVIGNHNAQYGSVIQHLNKEPNLEKETWTTNSAITWKLSNFLNSNPGDELQENISITLPDNWKLEIVSNPKDFFQKPEDETTPQKVTKHSWVGIWEESDKGKENLFQKVKLSLPEITKKIQILGSTNSDLTEAPTGDGYKENTYTKTSQKWIARAKENLKIKEYFNSIFSLLRDKQGKWEEINAYCKSTEQKTTFTEEEKEKFKTFCLTKNN